MKQMRKANRQMPAEWALKVFDRAPFVTLSMIRPDGIITWPVSAGIGKIYFPEPSPIIVLWK